MTNPAATLSAVSATARTVSHVEELVELFGTLRRPLLRYVRSFGISSDDAEEIGQETFLALFKHLKSGKSRENLPAWVFRVGHNLALKQRERARSVLGADCLTSYPDLSPNPEEQMLETRRRQKLQSVLRALTEQDRCCICLRAEGLRYREIAGILGMSLGAVSVSLTRSLGKFERAGQE